MGYVLFDIDVDTIKVGVSQDLQKLDNVIAIATPQKYNDGIKKILEAVDTLKVANVRAIAVGVRGILNGEKTEIAHDTVLSDWIDKPIYQKLKKEIGAEVYMENNASLAGLGEAVYGAGAGNEIVVYHTIGSGVGGAKIEDGFIDDYHTGFEPGRQILDIDHTILGDEVEPTLENLISASAVEKRMGMKPETIPQDDAIWDQLALYLAHGLRNSILYWSPDVIVLGGTMIEGDPHIEINNIVKHTNTVLGEVAETPLILKASLGEQSTLYGAMALLNQKV